MALKLNTNRTFNAPCTVYFQDENGKPASGSFGATYKVVPMDSLKDEHNSDKTLLDLVLVSVNESELELQDENGNRLTGDDLIRAVKNDPAISMALVSTYNEQITKKNLKRT
ncbi:hypothetical protein [Oceanospirillum sp.]|uniref:hypothetical protein n=1 Tax=Oceanospirillum sp. TaxID=2021254 RepID=UPI003A8E7A3C